MSLLDGAELKEHKPKISEEERLGFAAIAWTFPKTRHLVMDTDLAGAFAEILDIVVNGGFNTVDSYVEFIKDNEARNKKGA